MKKCTFCGEEVQEEAIKCRYCKEWLSKPSASIERTADIPKKDNSNVSMATTSEKVTGEAVRDSSSLTKWLKIFLYATIVIDVIAVISGILQFQLLSDFKKGVYTSPTLAIAAAESNDKRQQIVDIFQGFIYLIYFFLFLRWLHRANYNIRQLGARNMKFTPGWSIGWYFIPIASLYKPYQVIKEIWKASKNPDNWESQAVSPILPWWWFFVIINVFFGKVLLKSAMRAKGLDDLMWLAAISNAWDVFSVPLAILTIVLVNRIYEMQTSLVNRGLQYASSTSSSYRAPLSSSGNRGILIALGILGGVVIIGIILAIAIPGYLGIKDRERKAQVQNEQATAQSPAKADIFDQIAQEQKATNVPAQVQSNTQGLVDDLGVLKDRWTFVASGNDWIKQNFFYDRTSVHYPYGNKDNVRVWTKVENITPIATNNPPVNIKYTTVLIEIDCRKKTGTWLEENYIGDDGLIFRTDHKNKTQYISPDMFWQHLYKSLCQ